MSVARALVYDPVPNTAVCILRQLTAAATD
ncbi:hypothetical protein CEXT_26551, partial [Caerostris extrusa]